MKNYVPFPASLKSIAYFSFFGVRHLKAVEGLFLFCPFQILIFYFFRGASVIYDIAQANWVVFVDFVINVRKKCLFWICSMLNSFVKICEIHLENSFNIFILGFDIYVKNTTRIYFFSFALNQTCMYIQYPDSGYLLSLKGKLWILTSMRGQLNSFFINLFNITRSKQQ